MNIEPLLYWAKEREAIRLRREIGESWPWTADPILREYRFCNLERERDKVTLWIFENWIQPNASDPDVWFSAAVARYLNLPETLSGLGYPVPWNSRRFAKIVGGRRLSRQKIFNGAYMISSKVKGEEKYIYLQKHLFAPLWRRREKLRPREGDTLADFHLRLMSAYGVGSFMAAQIIADVKHVGPLKAAPDWWTFAASGPGSRRGLNRILGQPVKAPWKEEVWREQLLVLSAKIAPEFEKHGLPRIDNQNLQNALCETDKYLRAKAGEGRPKQRYRGGPSVFNS